MLESESDEESESVDEVSEELDDVLLSELVLALRALDNWGY